MVKKPAEVVAPCLAALSDPHPRVRWAAINAIGQMCTDLGPALQACPSGEAPGRQIGSHPLIISIICEAAGGDSQHRAAGPYRLHGRLR